MIRHHPQSPVGPAMAAMLMLLTVFGPLSMDLYLPVLPELARDLEAPASAAQLTVTACLIGLASGQLVAGPLSDRFGRRRPLIVGILAYIAASVLCAFSPRSEEHTSELQSRGHLVCRLLLQKTNDSHLI